MPTRPRKRARGHDPLSQEDAHAATCWRSRPAHSGAAGLAQFPSSLLAQHLSSSGLARGADEIESHGLSAFGDLKLKPDFPHFDYVDPNAPKGGTFVQLAGAGTATFNSLNGFILKGDPALDMGLVFASLMARAFDEPDADLWACRRAGRGLRRRADLPLPAARGHQVPRRQPDHRRRRRLLAVDPQGEGASRLSASCCATWRARRPRATGSRSSALPRRRARDVPLFAAALPIFSRAYYATRPFGETTLEPPLGSGPYRVGRFEQGRYLEFERVKDWWGSDLPSTRGQYNFDVAALRVLPRPRDRLRRLHRQELHVPRGIHLAHLGDALRVPGDPRRPRQARDHPRRAAFGRAGLDDQHAARAVR